MRRCVKSRIGRLRSCIGHPRAQSSRRRLPCRRLPRHSACLFPCLYTQFKKGKKRKQAQEEAEALFAAGPNSALCIALAKMHITVAVEQVGRCCLWRCCGRRMLTHTPIATATHWGCVAISLIVRALVTGPEADGRCAARGGGSGLPPQGPGVRRAGRDAVPVHPVRRALRLHAALLPRARHA